MVGYPDFEQCFIRAFYSETLEYRRKRKRKSKTTMVLGLKFFGSSNENYWLRAIKLNVYTHYNNYQK